MSLKVHFKRAYLKVFDGKKGRLWPKVATVTVPVASSLLFAFGGPYSDERTPAGDQQYRALQGQIETLGKKQDGLKEILNEVTELNELMAYSDGDAALKARLEQQRALYNNSRAAMDTEVTRFRDRMVVSSGLSEEDALELAEKAQDRASYILWPSDSHALQNLRYLDECQIASRHVQLKAGATPADYAEAVVDCSKAETDKRENAALIGGIGGIPAAGFLLFGLNALGRVFRRQISRDEWVAERRKEEKRRKREEKKNISTTLKVVMTPDRK